MTHDIQQDAGQRPDIDAPTARGDTVERAAEAIRGLIFHRRLHPGQKLLQDELCQITGFGRGPVREALRALSNEGVTTHLPNRGFIVTQFNLSEMEQMYKLRDMAEGAVLRSLPTAEIAQIADLRQINDRIKVGDTTVGEAMRLNHQFHFKMFEASPLKLIVSEIERWWKLSEPYRALGIGIWSERAEMMGHAHDAQIDAWVGGDLERLVDLCHEHRWVSFRRIAAVV